MPLGPQEDVDGPAPQVAESEPRTATIRLEIRKGTPGVNMLIGNRMKVMIEGQNHQMEFKLVKVLTVPEDPDMIFGLFESVNPL